jgi:hypothetical protein
MTSFFFFFRASGGNQPTGVRSGVLIPEPPWSTVLSSLRFGTAAANPTDSGIEVDNGDLAVDTRAGTGLSGSSEPEEV